MLDPPDEGDIRIVDKNVSAQRFIEIVEGLAPDGDGSPEPDEPEAMSRRALRPHRVITEAHTSR
jgi:hypothetical protein